MRSSYLIAFVAGCSFSTSVNNTEPGNDASPMKDSSMPGGEMVPPDARVCFGAGFGMTCLPTAPMQPRQLSNTNNFDTNTASNCTHIITIGTVETCVLTGTTVTMPGGGTFRAVGPRPLVIVAATTIEIMGNVSVSSLRGQGSGAGASTATCPTAAQGEDDSGGGGGGAGGTFMTKGGDGGTGDTNDGNPGAGGSAANAMAAPTTIRGGCGAARGGNATQNGGSGGAGGGAVYLIAGTSIQISGGVFAGGAGGNSGGTRGGGGGGGSGGFVGLDAPAITITGAVTANGGGAGEGGGFGAGQSGSDATTNDQRAAGGANEPDGGNGGGGGALAGTTGGTGGNSEGGGGGGGGGTGYIYVKGTLGGAGTISPAASVF